MAARKRKNNEKPATEEVVNTVHENELTNKYRVKDVDGNTADFPTLEELAESIEINIGMAYKYCDRPKTFMGLKIYTLKH